MSAVLCAVLFLSGVAGLIFETLWFHQTGPLANTTGAMAGSLLGGFVLLRGPHGDPDVPASRPGRRALHVAAPDQQPLDVEDAFAILHALCDAFPDRSLWSGAGWD